MADLKISVDIDARRTKQGSDQAKKNIKDVREETDKLGRSAKSAADRDVQGLSQQLAGLGRIAGPVSAAVVAIGAAVLGIAAAAAKAAEIIFNLAKAFAAYAKEIYTANEVTGLSISLLSALKAQADLTGRSFDEIVEGIKQFAKTIADANNESKEASAKLVRLGIDAKKAATDLDGAFEQVVKKIVATRAGVEQMAAATDAFGENGPKLLPFLKDFGGDLDRLKEKARELGLMLSVEDVRAGKEFNRTLAEIQALLRSVGITFGRELLPIVRDVLTSIISWFRENKDAVKDWAVTTADAISGFITALDRVKNWIADNEFVVRFLLAASTFGTSELFIGAVKAFGNAGSQLAAQGRQNRLNRPLPVNPDVQNEVPTRIPGVDYGDSYFIPKPGQPGSQTRRSPSTGRSPGISDEQRQAEQLTEQLKRLRLEVQFFGDNSRFAAVAQQLMASGVYASNKAIADQIVVTARQLDGLEAAKKKADEAAEAAKKLREEFAKEKSQLTNDSFRENVGLGAELSKLKEQIALGRELTAVEEARIDIFAERLSYERELQLYGYSQEQIGQLLAIFDVEKERTLEILKQVQAKRDQIAAEAQYKAVIADLDGEFVDLTIQLHEYTTGLQITRVELLLMSEAYKKLNAEQQQEALNKARQIDDIREAIKAQEEARRAYDDFYNTIRDGLETLAEQGFGAFFKNVMRKFRSFLLDLFTQWITSKFFNAFFKGGNAQTAAANGSGSGGIAGAIQNAIFGGASASGQGPGGTPVFNPGGGNISASSSVTHEGVHIGGGGTRIPGAVAGISAGASIVGGLIGGTAGNIISLAGTGFGIGWAIGGPIGGAIGAGVGALAGILMRVFGGDPKRKRDKNEKMPQLTRGFTDALAELRQLVADVRTLRVAPESAISRATELRNAIASGFGIQFESNKYRKEAQRLIASRLAEADALIIELRRVSEVANAASERDRRLIPEFASGVFMSRDFMQQFSLFKERNGMLPGSFTGRDTIGAMLAPGEMVLNPLQQDRVRRNAGVDPFVNAGIPGYSGSGSNSGQAADTQPSYTFVFEHSIDAAGMIRTQLKDPTVQRELKIQIEDKFRNDELKTKRRGL